MSLGGAASGAYVYDGNLKRVKQVVDGETIYSVYSQSGAILYRDNATTGVATDYIRAAGKTISRLKGSVTVFPHQDHLGSPIAETGLSGAVNWREAYSAYGEKRLDPAGNRDDEGFTGHIDDAATGLTYMQARYYDPVIGRFLSNDPVVFSVDRPQYFNRYSYCMNDPVNCIDPDGEFAIAAAIPAVIGLVACFFGCDDVVEAAIGRSDGTIVGDTVFNGVQDDGDENSGGFSGPGYEDGEIDINIGKPDTTEDVTEGRGSEGEKAWPGEEISEEEKRKQQERDLLGTGVEQATEILEEILMPDPTEEDL